MCVCVCVHARVCKASQVEILVSLYPMYLKTKQSIYSIIEFLLAAHITLVLLSQKTKFRCFFCSISYTKH